MIQTKERPSDMPTWEALLGMSYNSCRFIEYCFDSRVLLIAEPSEASGDGDSDTEEVDQIQATPAPSLISSSNRPVYKRKESDWEIESIPKRVKHGSDGVLNDSRRSITGASTLDYICGIEL